MNGLWFNPNPYYLVDEIEHKDKTLRKFRDDLPFKNLIRRINKKTNTMTKTYTAKLTTIRLLATLNLSNIPFLYTPGRHYI